ncbi:hypothetical protein ACGF07_31765 [Kitasatospora sp. NPDC048194]|uniref:hypothetical protein n=1 Tax=Kitasatospora sp. NPDC048194 TaxID=3364045 RepID=UPI003723F647
MSTTTTTVGAIAEACRALDIPTAEQATLTDLQTQLQAKHPHLGDRARRLVDHAGMMLGTVLWVGVDGETGREGLADVLDLVRRAGALVPGGAGYFARATGGFGCALCGRTAPESVTADDIADWYDGHADMCDPRLPARR